MKKIISILSAALIAIAVYSQPNLKVGILSDVHIDNADTKAMLEKALEYFRDADVDAVMIAGDISNNGMECELKDFMYIYRSVFPKDRGLKRKKVERLFVYGNHEIAGHKYKTVKKLYSPEEIERGCIAPRRAEVWENVFKEPFEPYYLKKVKGYVFIGGQYGKMKDQQTMEEFFKENASEIPSDKPFFYFQHQPPKNTCSGPDAWGQDNGKSTEILSRYPNAIAFAGHTHYSLTDEKTIWQGAFTCVGTASLRYSIAFEKGYENGKIPAGKVSQMPYMKGRDTHQGMLMSVYEDRVELLRHEFGNDEDLGTWVIPLGTGAEKPYTFENRVQNMPAPEFGPEDKVSVQEKPEGRDRAKNPTEQVVVKFPSIGAKDGRPRSYTFRVDVETVDGDSVSVYMSKAVIGRGSNLGEKTDLKRGSSCVFAKSELPLERKYRFAVYPQNSFGKEGEPIFSEIQ